MLNASLRRFRCLIDGPRNAFPSLGFDFELLSSSPAQAVEFRAAIIFRVSPKRRNSAFLLHSMQSGKERTWLDNKSAACDLLDSARDSQSVHLACNKGL